MKSAQKITRVQLKGNHIDESLWLGIVSAEPDYKLSLILNKKFNLSLKSHSPVIINDDNGSELEFSRFSDLTYSPDIFFNLISNRSGNNFLLKKLKNIDFIFQVHNLNNKNDHNQFTSRLRETRSITAVFIIDSMLIKEKSLQHLIL
jgi:hypothetical protein